MTPVPKVGKISSMKPPSTRLYATLRVQGAIDPDEVSKLLEIQPTHFHRVNDINPVTDCFYGTAAWHYSTKSLRSKRLGTHIRWLSQQLQPQIENLRNLQSNGADVFLSLYFAQASNCIKVNLTTEMLNDLAILDELNVRLWIDVYSLPGH